MNKKISALTVYISVGKGAHEYKSAMEKTKAWKGSECSGWGLQFYLGWLGILSLR